MPKGGITRRSFAKASALAGMAAGLGASMPAILEETDRAFASEPEETKVLNTSCHGCIEMCPVRAYVKNGVVTKLEGHPDGPISRGSVCIKCLNQLHTMYSPRRILHPMKRAGERGENKWEVISWDEAIELAASQIVSAIDKYGPYAFFCSTGGGGAYSFVESMSLPNALGSPTVFEPGGSQCYMPRWAMAQFMYGGSSQSIANDNAVEIYKDFDNHADTFVIWGAQPSISQTAGSGRGMAEMRAKGLKTVVVDPNFSPDAMKADVWLPVKPGTDPALLLSWYRYIFENGLYDEQFTKYWTNLPFLIDPDTKMPVEAQELFPEFVSTTPENTPDYVCYDLRTSSVQPFPFSLPADSPVDPEVFATVSYGGKEYKTAGQIYREQADPWTLERAAEVCWLDEDDIEKAIRLYAEADVAGIGQGVASDQTPQSSQVPLGCLGLDAIMGYVNVPGAVLTQQGEGETAHPTKRPVSYYNGLFGMFSEMYGVGAGVGLSESENKARVESFPKETREQYGQMLLDRLGVVDHKGLYFWCQSHIPTVRNAILTGEPYKPRVWFDLSGNKLAVLADAGSWMEVFPEVDFIIGQHPILTSFHIEACDLVFPLREWLEEPMVNFQQLNTTWLQNECTHIGETVSHTIPAGQVLERCKEKWGGKLPGLVPGFTGAPTEQGVKEEVAKTLKAPSWDELIAHTEDYVPCVIPREEYWAYGQHETIVDDGLPAGFATESRKFEVYCTLLLRMARTGYPFTYPYELPACEDYSPICEFNELPDTPESDPEYPLILTNGRVPYFHHSTMRQAPFARELFPTAEIRINTRKAHELGIEHMDWVKVSSPRGEMHARAYLTEGLNPGVVWMERFWNPECFDESQQNKTAGWRECNPNLLTKKDGPYNEVFGSYTLRGCTVKVEKSEKPVNVWVEPKEFEPFMPTLKGEARTEDVY